MCCTVNYSMNYYASIVPTNSEDHALKMKINKKTKTFWQTLVLEIN